MTRRWRLFPKYALLIIALVGGMLVASGIVGSVFAYRESEAHLEALQVEKAQGAATRIEQYVQNIEHQLSWTALPRIDTGGDALEARRIEYFKLLRQAPAITEVAWIDPGGREQLRIGRLAMEAVSSGADMSLEPKFIAARAGKTHLGAVYFRKGTEPYMTIARPAGSGGGVTVAEVNLKFVWEVVSRIRIGQAGLAYVIDASGTLIAHPDISLVLKKTDLTALPQVAALARADADTGSVRARDLRGEEVLAAHARIPTLAWTVFVETPRTEAFAPLYDTVLRLGLVLAAGLLLAMVASFFLARALVRPLRALQEGAEQIGAGELDHRITVQTGDELESLAERFNKMGADLKASYAGLERKVEQRTSELSETLGYQTAISEVLRVISRSSTDVTPVFEAVLESASRLFGHPLAAVFRYDGALVHMVATRNWSSEAIADARRLYPKPPNPQMMSGRVILSGEVQHEEDTLLDPAYDQTMARTGHWRRMLGAPLLREGAPVGAIVLAWPDPGVTPKRQTDLLKTFADQAVIAIENVRLISETQEALEQQTSTAEILRVISGSITDTRPVFDAIVRSCQRLFGGKAVALVLPKGEMIETQAFASDGADMGSADAVLKPWPLDRGSGAGSCILDSRVIAVADTVEAATHFSRMRDLALAMGYHSALFVPLLRDAKAIGCIAILRAATGEFDAKEVSLAQTFADQAVIAIENVRLFNETREALEQQTATAEVLQVISSSVADTQPVFDKILDSCQRLFAIEQLAIYLVHDDGQLHLGAFRGVPTQAVNLPKPLDQTATGVAIRERRMVHIPDTASATDLPPTVRESAARIGHFSIAFAPMLWEERGIGSIAVIRQPPSPFTDKELALLKTFADQAVIAIQNSRLFHEIQDKSRELEQANKHKSEFLANMSHELRTPLNAIIGFSEVLSEEMFGEVNDKQKEYLHDIHSSGHHLLGLINDILDLSKIEAGRMELELSSFHLGLLLDNSTTLVRERASRQGLSLALDVEEGLADWVADERKLKQVVINLLSNAVKFTPSGGKVTLRARRVEPGVEIAVIDTGVGIAPDQQALVFEEFRQAGGDYLRKAEGTGLGLSLAKRFVELHGGAIRVESQVGCGSTFAFILPERGLPAAS